MDTPWVAQVINLSKTLWALSGGMMLKCLSLKVLRKISLQEAWFRFLKPQFR